jgi:hypothetical protein
VGIDWSNVVTSGSVSAVVGGVVALVTARQVAGRQHRGHAAVDARCRLREVVRPELTMVRQYKAGEATSRARGAARSSSVAKRWPLDYHVHDFAFCGRVLAAAEDLPRWRAYLIKRRLRTLFGERTFNACDANGADAGQESFARSRLHWQYGEQRNEADPDTLARKDCGTYDKALRCASDTREVASLARSMHRLSRGW